LSLILDDIFGSPNVGVYGFCNETVCLVPFGVSPRKAQRFREVLNAPVLECSIGGSYVIGALVSGNSQGILVPHTVRDY
jgi:translation initiation factor 6